MGRMKKRNNNNKNRFFFFPKGGRAPTFSDIPLGKLNKLSSRTTMNVER